MSGYFSWTIIFSCSSRFFSVLGSDTGCSLCIMLIKLYHGCMIDVELLRKEPERVKKAIATKKADPQLVDTFLALDKEWREAVTRVDIARAEQKKLGEERKIEEAKALKEKIHELEEQIAMLEKERDLTWAAIPNLPFDDVPVGKDESENVVIRAFGEPTKFDFEPKDHVALGEALGVIEIKKAGEVSGSRFAYLKGDAARMEFAIVQYVFEVLSNQEILKSIAERIEPGYSAKVFLPVVPPVMIRPDVFRRMGRLSAETEEERYYLPKDDLYLVGSAEHTLGPLHMDEVIPEAQLPIRYIGFSTAFRRESGSYGKDVRGILRVHQFDKLEIESFTTSENSRKEQDFIVAIQEYLLQQLELPYQVVAICTGDMGAPDARQIDINTWIPSQEVYRETHTSDLMTDYQSRRLSIKVRRADQSTEFVHMNDATAFAIGRILIAILENYQTREGQVRVPTVLQKYMMKEVIE